VKIVKRSFEATNDDVVAEVLRISMSLILGGVEPTLTKIKQDLKCSEADLLPIIQRSEALEITNSRNRRNTPVVLPSQRYFPKVFANPENITSDFVRNRILKTKENDKKEREENIARMKKSET